MLSFTKVIDAETCRMLYIRHLNQSYKDCIKGKIAKPSDRISSEKDAELLDMRK